MYFPVSCAVGRQYRFSWISIRLTKYYVLMLFCLCSFQLIANFMEI